MMDVEKVAIRTTGNSSSSSREDNAREDFEICMKHRVLNLKKNRGWLGTDRHRLQEIRLLEE